LDLIPPNLPFKKGRSCHVIHLIREIPLFEKEGFREIKNLKTKKSPQSRGFFISKLENS